MRIPIDTLTPDTLKRVVEEYVTREGTDYGFSTTDLATKVEQVLRQLKSGKAMLFFDPESETCHIVSKDNPLARSVNDKEDDLSFC